ncbi:MAG: peptide-methionine (R)-S-oxide reductase, partial [Verrucomicrobiota bacterium]
MSPALPLALLLAVTLTAKEPVKPVDTDNEKVPAGKVRITLHDGKGGVAKPTVVDKVVKSDAEWQALLPPETYRILRAKGTERPFCGTLLDNKKHGTYHCVGCELPLFSSDSKFNSGTGWPSFFRPV